MKHFLSNHKDLEDENFPNLRDYDVSLFTVNNLSI